MTPRLRKPGEGELPEGMHQLGGKLAVQGLLLGARHQDHSYAISEDQPFLEAKKYTATANLMRPSEGFFAAIQLLEREFAGNANSDAFWPLTQITKKMERALGSLGVFNSLFSSHPEHASL
ncbi:unnamed protein product [Boreogadus saida]